MCLPGVFLASRGAVSQALYSRLSPQHAFDNTQARTIDAYLNWSNSFDCRLVTEKLAKHSIREDRRLLVLCSMGVLGRAETYWYPDSSKGFAYFQVSNWQKVCLGICFKTFAYVFSVILKISQIYVSRLYEVSHRLQCIHTSAELGRHIKKHACIGSHAKQVANPSLAYLNLFLFDNLALLLKHLFRFTAVTVRRASHGKMQLACARFNMGGSIVVFVSFWSFVFVFGFLVLLFFFVFCFFDCFGFSLCYFCLFFLFCMANLATEWDKERKFLFSHPRGSGKTTTMTIASFVLMRFFLFFLCFVLFTNIFFLFFLFVLICFLFFVIYFYVFNIFIS